ncbi:hypothetical protein BSKO_01852 [Bryopsis sp. KO-2023]|nr:hypothetical protein BSKO_01852 [Bryopsis sp. KO-2023]
MDVSEDELHGIYTWVDEVPLSRPKRNISRDFADGVLMAELIRHYLPKLVQLHNYSAANGVRQKMYNWQTLNAKLLKKVGMTLRPSDIEKVVNGEPGAIERVLKLARVKIAEYQGRVDRRKDTLRSDDSLPKTSPPGSLTKLKETRYARLGSDPHLFSTDISNLSESVTGTQMEHMGGGHDCSSDLIIDELRETNRLLDAKVAKLEQLLRLKDVKIQTLNTLLVEKDEGPGRTWEHMGMSVNNVR